MASVTNIRYARLIAFSTSTVRFVLGHMFISNGKKTRVKGENDERISKSEVFVSNIFDLTQILFPGKIPITGSDSPTSKKSCMPGLLFYIMIF